MHNLYMILLALLYGLIAGACLLSFLKLYKPLPVFLLSALLSGIMLFLFFNKNHSDVIFMEEESDPTGQKSWLPLVVFLTAIVIFAFLIFYPLSAWPYPATVSELHWDAGVYHFPKAAEMISTGSSWDLSIAYGEYPFGYESLVAFFLLLGQQGRFIGVLHAIIALFFLLSITSCFKRTLKLNDELILFIIVALFISNKIIPTFDSNLWWIFWPQLMLVGKNDLLLAAVLVSILIFTPKPTDKTYHPYELAVASMIAISIKPNSLLIVLFAWAVLFFHMLKRKELSSYIKPILISVLIMLPGSLWIIRNWVVQKALFSAETLQLSDWSILSNLTNPFLYHYLPRNLIYILSILLIGGVISIFVKRIRFEWLTAMIFLISFAMTPATAFFGSTAEPAQIAWRFAMPLLVYTLLLLLLLVEPLLIRIYRWINAKSLFSIPASIILIALAIIAIRADRGLFDTNPQNRYILSDQYHESVGINGYHSAYDYVQQNISNSVINIENGFPYYLYDKHFTNSVSRSKPADYFVFLQTPWINDGGYPEKLDEKTWKSQWNLIYEDAEGRVYQRK